MIVVLKGDSLNDDYKEKVAQQFPDGWKVIWLPEGVEVAFVEEQSECVYEEGAE